MLNPAFKHYSLTVPLQSPLVLNAHPLHLDAIIAAMLADHHMVDLKETKPLLREWLQETNGVFHSSAVLFICEEGGEIHYAPMTCIKSMRREKDLNKANFAPNGTVRGRAKSADSNDEQAETPYKSVVIEGGPYKSRVQHHPGYWAPKLRFYARGRTEGLLDLLKFHIGGIGKNGNAGAGSCDWSEAVIEETPRDYSFLTQKGGPNRILPLDLYCGLTGRKSNRLPGNTTVRSSAVAPPYFDNEQHTAIIPKPVRRVSDVH